MFDGLRWNCLLRHGLLAASLAAAGAADAEVAIAQGVPPGIPVPPPPFHFSDPVRDREHRRARSAIDTAYPAYGRSMRVADTLLWQARNARPGSDTWLRARDAVQRAVRDWQPLRQAFSGYISFLIQASLRSPREEASTADALRFHAQEELLLRSNALMERLERLARIDRRP